MDKEYLIEKFLNNELTEAEQSAFESLEDFDLHKNIIENAVYFKANNFSELAAFESIEHRLETTTKVKKLNWITPLMRIAGVFAVGFGIYFLFFFTTLTNISTIAGEKTVIELPDGSIVNLNALSEISYNRDDWNSNRHINLDGEAFFKVAKGKIFDIETSLGKVTVVGTQFNVKKRENFFEVVCYEGIVKITTKDTVKTLLAGDTFRLCDGEVSFSNTSFKEPQWTKNMSSFKSVPLRLVIIELEQQYNISITYNPDLENLIFTGGFTHNSLQDALKSITVPLELTYKIESSKTVILLKNGQ